MKKIALGALLVLLLIIGGSVYFLLSNLDGLVKTAIETYGSEATKTAVSVSSVKIVLQDGSGSIQGLTVGNPKGFAGAAEETAAGPAHAQLRTRFVDRLRLRHRLPA